MAVVIEEPLASRIERLAIAHGFDSPLDYMGSLIDAEEADPFSEVRDEIEVMLIEGLDSGPGQAITPAFWEEMRAIANECKAHAQLKNRE